MGDELGSITHVTDENGIVLNRYAYDAFGNRTVCEEKIANRFGHAGEMYDGITQQYYLRARFYNPVIGRFTQEDTYYGDGLNLYEYGRNNPMRYIDPSGHEVRAAAEKNYVNRAVDAMNGTTDQGVNGMLERVYGGTNGLNSSFAKNIDDILAKQGITLEEFHSLRLKDASTLTDAEKATMKTIRESVPMPDADTLMQKVIPADDIRKYMDGSYTKVGGYVTRAEDVAQLSTCDALYESLRLDYPGSVHKPMADNSIGTIRYTTDETSKIVIPYGEEMGGTVTEEPPFTGNGFTGARNGEIIPEFKCDGYLEVDDGAKLIEVNKDGTETLKAVYSKIDKMFIPVE